MASTARVGQVRIGGFPEGLTARCAPLTRRAHCWGWAPVLVTASSPSAPAQVVRVMAEPCRRVAAHAHVRHRRRHRAGLVPPRCRAERRLVLTAALGVAGRHPAGRGEGAGQGRAARRPDLRALPRRAHPFMDPELRARGTADAVDRPRRHAAQRSRVSRRRWRRRGGGAGVGRRCPTPCHSSAAARTTPPSDGCWPTPPAVADDHRRLDPRRRCRAARVRTHDEPARWAVETITPDSGAARLLAHRRGMMAVRRVGRRPPV